jgi:superfamily II DNA or RNA helicase
MLVTTEMASRGLDLPRLSMCVNLVPPPSYTHYLHRAGRLGRIHTIKGHLRKGTVITLVSDYVRTFASPPRPRTVHPQFYVSCVEIAPSELRGLVRACAR